jgi:cobyrinic acid a,c-diamide synthase
MPHLLISAAHKSSGKTTVTLGLCAALRRRELAVQPFKKGPDYIDPMWLSLASGRACHNLDFYLQSHDEILSVFARNDADADISIIEGNKGLYDGLSLDGSNSNAALATLLQAPVVLVINARGMTRGIAPLILGYQAFDPNVNIAGVILNDLGGSRHESKLRAVIEHYTDVPVVGAVHHNEDMVIRERHLGLVPSNEATEAKARIDTIADHIAAQVDLDRLVAIAAGAPAPAPPQPQPSAAPRHRTDVRLGVARDAAFAFYYPGDLAALRTAGAELVYFDTLRTPHLPEVDGLFIGGGFPEVHLEALEANRTLRAEIRQAIEGGMPVYAECGGLMYLARKITWQGRSGDMVGAVPGDVVMHEKPQGRGYVRLRGTGKGPWPLLDDAGLPVEFPAHEFHYSSLENLPDDLECAFEVVRGTGLDGRRDGIMIHNTLACYAHLRDVASNHWTERFVEFVRSHRRTAPKSLHAADG